ncbi:unnamed protein product, partial [Rotaria sp. Silwood1]
MSHCHAPQPDRVPAIQLQNAIKARTATTDEPSSSILYSALRTYPLSAAGEVTTAFDLIADQFDDDANDLLDYFEKTWIGEPKRRGTGRNKPQFDHKLWNIHDRVIPGVPRSNNSVEGWHNAFTSRVSINHPNIVKLIEKIRREQPKLEVDIEKILQ